MQKIQAQFSAWPKALQRKRWLFTVLSCGNSVMKLAFPSSVGIDQAYPALAGRIKKNTSTVTSLRFMMQYGADI